MSHHALLLFSDALPPLAKLSKIFQRKQLPFSDVKILLDGTKAAIASLQEARGHHLSLLEEVAEFGDVGVYSNHATDLQLAAFKSQIEEPYLRNVIDNLNFRFPHTELIAAFDVFSGANLLEEGRHNDFYGNEEIRALGNRFSY